MLGSNNDDEAHFKMMVVDVDASMAENQKPFQRLGSWVCMGLNSAVAFLGRFHLIELGCLLYCLSSFVRRLDLIGLDFWPILVFKARSQDGNCCPRTQMENDFWSTASVGGRCLGKQTNT